jgi:ABC-type multidrug transport system fused ATPase/permease subunit
LKDPADKVRSLLSMRRSKRVRTGAGQAQYGQLPSSSSLKGQSSRTSSKSTVDDCDTTVCGDSELSYSSSSNFTIEDEDEDDNEIEDDNNSDYEEYGVEEGLQTPGSEGSPTLSESSKNVVVLRNISLTFPPGCLVAVCGSTGAGKSTLVAGLLGECRMLNGSVSMTGTVSYVSQTAWIQNASLRANILFGQEYEEEKYNAVVAACGLVVDLSSLPDGDMTDIGEKGEQFAACLSRAVVNSYRLLRTAYLFFPCLEPFPLIILCLTLPSGVNLSGGQQQRISLARAAYCESDIIVLDDPLSAVDTHLGDHIFHSLIRGYLANRTRVLVTNQVT